MKNKVMNNNYDTLIVIKKLMKRERNLKFL